MKITQNFYYIINYKPLLNYKKEVKNFNKIYCKNFFLFFLLLDFIKKQNSKSIKLSILKKISKSNSFLRAPNKYKKAQIKINLIRYKILFSFKNSYNLDFLKNLKLNNIIYVLNYFFYFFLFFESSFFFLEKKILKITMDYNHINQLFFEL